MKKFFLFVIMASLISQSSTVLLAYEGGRRPVFAKKGMVVSTSAAASQIGIDVLKQGGNAIDAAVATAFALAVTWPSAGNLGGGGFLLYHQANGEVTAFDFREKAPLAATRDMYLGPDGNVFNRVNHDSILAVGVPGTVAGLAMAHGKHGRLAWKDLVKPAEDLARNGYQMTWGLSNGLKSIQRRLAKHPSSAKVFYKQDGSAYEATEIWKQKDLAETLKRIRKQGHDGFYKGKTASLMAGFMRKNGGLITEEDMAQYQSIERTPVQGTYRGWQIYGMPPISSGGVTLISMLNILEGFELAKMGHNSASYLHFLTEAMRRSYSLRAHYLGDPAFNPDMPIERMISKAYADTLRSTIEMFRASESDSAKFELAYESDETTHFSVCDQQGNIVSLTYTLEHGYGSGIVVEGAGFLLNNEMGDFNAVPGLTNRRGRIGTPPNQISPGKRMLSSMTPTILAKDGVPQMAVGARGGRTIINTVLQIILNFVDHEMNIAQAVEAPRIHHQWLPDRTRLEKWGISPDTRTLYENMGHATYVRGTQGAAMGLHRDPETGIISGAADSRSPDGRAVGLD